MMMIYRSIFSHPADIYLVTGEVGCYGNGLGLRLIRMMRART